MIRYYIEYIKSFWSCKIVEIMLESMLRSSFMLLLWWDWGDVFVFWFCKPQLNAKMVIEIVRFQWIIQSNDPLTQFSRESHSNNVPFGQWLGRTTSFHSRLGTVSKSIVVWSMVGPNNIVSGFGYWHQECWHHKFKKQ